MARCLDASHIGRIDKVSSAQPGKKVVREMGTRLTCHIGNELRSLIQLARDHPPNNTTDDSYIFHTRLAVRLLFSAHSSKDSGSTQTTAFDLQHSHHGTQSRP